MQMSHFREILTKLSPKYITCSLKRCNIHVCILNGYKVMPFDTLKALFAQQQLIIDFNEVDVRIYQSENVILTEAEAEVNITFEG